MQSTLTKRWLMFLSIIVGSLSLSGCFHGKSHHKGGEMMFEYIAWKLDLRDEQQVLLDDVREEMKAIHQQQREQREKDKEMVIGLVRAETLDTGAAMALLEQKQTVMLENAPTVLEKVAAFHATLTAEQKDIIIEKLNKLDKRHH